MDQALHSQVTVNMTREAQLFVAVYITSVGVISTVGNLCVLVVLLRFRTYKKKSINLILINMAASDLGVSFSGYPMTSSSAYAGYWLYGDGGCWYLAFCVYVFSCSTIGSHTALAIYRYIYVCKPTLKHKLTIKFTGKILSIIWALALFWTVTPFLGWSSYTYEPFKLSCSLDWTGRSLGHTTYNLACVIGVFTVPVAIMMYCYCMVAKRSSKVDPTRMEVNDMGVVVYLQEQKKEKMDDHVTKMCILMMGSFVIAWSPYACLCLWMTLRKSQDIQLSVATSLLPTMFAKSSCMMNPLIYVISSSNYRKDFAKLLGASRERSVGPQLQELGTSRTGHNASHPLAVEDTHNLPGPVAGPSVSASDAAKTLQPVPEEATASSACHRKEQQIHLGTIQHSRTADQKTLITNAEISTLSSPKSESGVVDKDLQKLWLIV